MSYVMDEATYDKLRYYAENEKNQSKTRKEKGHAEGVLEVLNILKNNRIKDDIVIFKPER